MFKVTRFVATVVFLLTAAAVPMRSQGGTPNCDAIACTDECPVSENQCIAVCAWFNGESSPYYTEECHDYTYAQAGSTACIFDVFPCNDPESMANCNCTWDASR